MATNTSDASDANCGCDSCINIQSAKKRLPGEGPVRGANMPSCPRDLAKSQRKGQELDAILAAELAAAGVSSDDEGLVGRRVWSEEELQANRKKMADNTARILAGLAAAGISP